MLASGRLLLATVLISIYLPVQTGWADTQTIVMGGQTGLAWNSGGGQIEAVFQTGPREVDTGNTPGGVIQFDPEGRGGWIFPQRVTEGQNIALGLLERGGSVSSSSSLEVGIEEQLALMVDGDGETALERKNVTVIRGMIMDLDLGARFGVNGVQFFPRNAHPDFPAPDHPFQGDFIRGYELFFNDGTEDTKIDGRPILTSFKLDVQNDQAVVDLRIPPQYVRFVRLQSRTTLGFEVAELRVFGTGFVPSAEYLSNIFDLGSDLGLWGNIRWVEDSVGREGFAAAKIRTRTGQDDSPLVFTRRFFVGVDEVEVPWKRDAQIETATGEINLDEIDVETAKALYSSLPLQQKNEIALTLNDYQNLSSSTRGNVQDDLEAWSPWSSPYDLGEDLVSPENIDDDRLGVPITSPGPRRYIQFRVNFTSDAIEAGTGIGPLTFTVSTPPVAAQIIGEIFPRQVALGVPVDFTYAAMPTQIRPGVDTGFDRFEIATPVRAERVDEIQVTFADGQVKRADFSAVDLEALPATDASGQFAIEVVEDRRLRVRFPTITEGDLAAGRTPVLQIRFRCRVLRFGTKFSGFSSNSLEGGIDQEVLPGNVALLDPADDDRVPVGRVTQRSLSVDIPLSLGDPLLVNVRASPKPFSPNGDGVNDVTRIQYDLSRLIGAVPLKVKIFDLGGRLVRIFEQQQGGGGFAVEWDGRNDDGELLSPGIYLYKVNLDSDAGGEEVVRSIELVY